MIRILHVVRNMNIGGIETTLMTYNREIIKYGIRFDYLILSDSKGYFHNEILKLGGSVNYLDIITLKNIVGLYFKLVSFFKKNPYKYVHFHLDSNALIPLFAAAQAKVKNRIVHSHTSKSKNYKFLRGVFNTIIPLLATDLYACNLAAGKYMFGSRKSNIMINAIDIDKFRFNINLRSSLRREYKVKNKTVIGFVGSLVEEKNFGFLIDLFREFMQNNEEFVLVVLGDGPLYEDYIEQIKLYNLKDFAIFLGRKGNPEKYYNMMDLLVLPSHFEGSPVVVYEAAANGLYTMISDTVTLDFQSDRILKLSTSNLEEWNMAIKMHSQTQRSLDHDLLDRINIASNCINLVNYYE